MKISLRLANVVILFKRGNLGRHHGLISHVSASSTVNISPIYNFPFLNLFFGRRFSIVWGFICMINFIVTSVDFMQKFILILILRYRDLIPVSFSDSGVLEIITVSHPVLSLKQIWVHGRDDLSSSQIELLDRILMAIKLRGIDGRTQEAMFIHISWEFVVLHKLLFFS